MTCVRLISARNSFERTVPFHVALITRYRVGTRCLREVRSGRVHREEMCVSEQLEIAVSFLRDDKSNVYLQKHMLL